MGTPKHKTPQGKNVSKANTPKSAGKQTPKNTPGNVAKQTPKNTPGKTPKGNKGVSPKGTPKGNEKINSPAKGQTPQQAKKVQNGKPMGAFKTPQPQKGAKAGGKKTPKSAPPAHIKRKKLEEEIDEELSDDNFEELLGTMKKVAGKKKPVTADSDDDDEDDSDFDLDDDDDLSDLSDDDEDNDDDDDDEDDDDSDLLDDEEEEGEEGDEEDEEDDGDSEDEAAPAKKKIKKEVMSPAGKKAQPVKVQEAKGQKLKKEKVEEKKTTKRKAESQESKNQVLVSPELLSEDEKRKEEQSKRTLFIKNYPFDATEEDIKALSKEILTVSLHFSFKNHGKKVSRGYGFLMFKDESTAEKNLKLLNGKMYKGRALYLDYCGSKSQHSKPNKLASSSELDPKKLYITGFDKSMTPGKLKMLFPAATEIQQPKRKANNVPCGYAFAFFASEAAAKQSYDKMKNKVIDGRTLVVLFAKRKDPPNAEKRKQQPDTKKGPAAKKQKVDELAQKKKKKEEEEEGEDDDDDDDEEDDDDDFDDEEEDDDDMDDDDDDDDDDDGSSD